MSLRNAFTLAKVSACVLVTVAAIAALASWQAQPPTSSIIEGGGEWTPEDWALFKEKVRFGASEGLDALPLGDAIARMAETFVGAPYEPGTLEVPGPEELVINFRALDCVTLVETVLALTRFAREDGVEALDDPAAARAIYASHLTELRYRGGVLDGYPSRLHYFSEWMTDNAARGRVELVTPALDPVPDPERINFMSEHADAYRQLSDPAFLEAIRATEARLATGPDRLYVPEDRIAAVADRIRNGDVIAATSTVEGLDIAHTGLAYWREGELHLLHAPLVGSHVEISERPLAERILELSAQDGIMVARPLER